MGLIVDLPNPVLATTSLGGSATYSHVDYQFDYAINGVPFLSAVDAQHPMVRQTAPYRKDSQSATPEPGEQSLAFWWIKAQSSFHGGAGQTYLDTPVTQGTEVRQIRYNTSAGVNPWTQGKLSLLKTTSKAVALTGTAPIVKAFDTAAGRGFLYTDGNNLYVVSETVTSGVPSYGAPTLLHAAAATITSLVFDGVNAYWTDGLGVMKLNCNTFAGVVQIYSMPGGTAVLGWVKQRLMLGFTSSTASSVYELNANSTGAAALPTAKFTHPNATWAWTSFASSPAAIYAAGYARTNSAVYKFLLDANGVTPTLTTGLTTAELPPGEVVYGMYTYLGSALALATSRGLRVAFINPSGSGDFEYGPLSVSTAATTGSVTGQDRFLFYSYTDSSGVAGLARVDLSQQLTIRAFSYTPDQRFSWAPDLRATNSTETFVSGTTTSVDQLAGRLVFAVSGQGIFVEHPSKLTPSGTLTTSRIRYDTLDPKIVRYIRVRTEGSGGTVTVAVNGNTDQAGTVYATVTSATSNDSGDAPVYLSTLQYATVQFTLNRESTDTTSGAILLGYQLKALPAQRRQRFIQVPLRCFDYETDSSGQMVTYAAGNARARLIALEGIEQAGDIVSFQMLSPYADQQYSTLCVLEDVKFEQTSAPTERQGWGGIITLTVRTVE